MDDFTRGFLMQKGIEDEITYKDYIFNDEDRKTFDTLIQEINAMGYDFKYFATFDECRIPKSGPIIKRYIWQFRSETTRSYLATHLALDKKEVSDCDRLVLDLYLHFKNSTVYIAAPNSPTPAHIYVRYDNAFRVLKPKRLKNEIVALIRSPRDTYYLPLTVNMVASWRISEVKDILTSYLDDANITASSVGLHIKHEAYDKQLEYIRRDLKFVAIGGLKYYCTDDVVALIKPYAESEDADICAAAKKSLKYMEKRMT